jgi:hypothetical protein
MTDPTDDQLDLLLNQIDMAARHTDQYAHLPIWNNPAGRHQLREIVRTWLLDLQPETHR